jgi:cytidylate kinase
MNRPLNPLCKAEDATEIDSSHMDIDQVVKAMLDVIKG